jgi:hypothetical protein
LVKTAKAFMKAYRVHCLGLLDCIYKGSVEQVYMYISSDIINTARYFFLDLYNQYHFYCFDKKKKRLTQDCRRFGDLNGTIEPYFYMMLVKILFYCYCCCCCCCCCVCLMCMTFVLFCFVTDSNHAGRRTRRRSLSIIGGKTIAKRFASVANLCRRTTQRLYEKIGESNLLWSTFCECVCDAPCRQQTNKHRSVGWTPHWLHIPKSFDNTSWRFVQRACE